MNPIKDPIKDTLVPLRTNFNANGSVRWRTSVYLNLFHWPMGKNLVILMGFVDTFEHCRRQGANIQFIHVTGHFDRIGYRV